MAEKPNVRLLAAISIIQAVKTSINEAATPIMISFLLMVMELFF
jgi:hypothetical protein